LAYAIPETKPDAKHPTNATLIAFEIFFILYPFLGQLRNVVVWVCAPAPSGHSDAVANQWEIILHPHSLTLGMPTSNAHIKPNKIIHLG
jgi:hypothetical protein